MVGQGKEYNIDTQIHSFSDNISRLLRIYVEVEVKIRCLVLRLIFIFRLPTGATYEQDDRQGHRG